MGYVVVKDFSDIQDNKHIYRTGDTFPRAGLKVSKDRVAELSSTDNMRGEVLIEAVDVPEKAHNDPQAAVSANSDKTSASKEKRPRRAKKKEI